MKDSALNIKLKKTYVVNHFLQSINNNFIEYLGSNQCNIGDKVKVYSRSGHQWTKGIIIKRYENWVQVQYSYDQRRFQKHIQTPHKHLKKICNIKSRLTIIFVRSQPEGCFLIEQLGMQQHDITQMRLWKSSQASEIRIQVEHDTVNVIVIAIGHHWNPYARDTLWLINNVDIVITYEFKSNQVYYKYSRDMLKASGYLVKISKCISFAQITCENIFNGLFNFDDWVAIRLKYLLLNIQIPHELQLVIIQYCKDNFMIHHTKCDLVI